MELLAAQISRLKGDFPVLLNCSSREVFHSIFRIIDDQPVAQTPIQLTSIERFNENSGGVPVVLYRVSPERRKLEPLFEKLVLLPLDYPVPDALLLDSLGAKKLAKPSFDPFAPVNPLYIKRDIENRHKVFNIRNSGF